MMLYRLKKFLRSIGVEVRRYTVQTSEGAQLSQLLKHCQIDLVLDVGANAGHYASSLRDHGYHGAIVSFEPLTLAHERLVKAAANDTRWQVAPRMALGEEEGEVRIRVAGNSVSSSVLDMLAAHESAAPESGFVGSEMVPLRRLDRVAGTFLQGSRTVLLKIDTQGYEDRVLNGAETVMDKIAAIQVELSMIPLYAGQLLFDEMRRKIEGLGYVLFAIFPAYVNPATGQTLQVDGFFVRKSATERIA